MTRSAREECPTVNGEPAMPDVDPIPVTLWMSVKHLFGVHTDYVSTTKLPNNQVYWDGKFRCAVCKRRSR